MFDVGARFRDVVRIVAGSVHVCALTRDGTVSCWGGGPRDSDEVGIVRPTRERAKEVRTFAVTGVGHCVVAHDDRVRCDPKMLAGAVIEGL